MGVLGGSLGGGGGLGWLRECQFSETKSRSSHLNTVSSKEF